MPRGTIAILEQVFHTRTAAEWVELLNAGGVACGPIYTVDQVFADPQVRRANLAREVSNAAWGPHKVLALPLTLSRTPAEVRHAAPMTGEHTRQVLEELGYEAAAVDRLLANGIVQEHRGGSA